MNIALTLCPASIYQMMRGAVVLVVALMAFIFLKRMQYRHHVTSLAVIVLGVFLVGLSSIINEDDSEEASNTGLGIMLIIISQIFVGIQFITEEKLFGDYYLDPLKVVGLEGMWGVIYWIVLLPCFQLITCGSEALCPYGKLSYTTMAFEQFGNNSVLIWLSVGICLSIAGFNGCGVSVTKFASAAQRSTIDTCRTVVVWVVFMAMPKGSAYKEHFYWIQFIGFIILVCGTLVYNEIFEIPFCGFDQYTKAALARKRARSSGLKGDDEKKLKESDYISLSPHHGYDATRNQRNINHKMEETLKEGDDSNMYINATHDEMVTDKLSHSRDM
mmetsp:Transcript_32670/g.31886  ORF Transcript_32670/g.31886 Transcript_32670/m.31886 type:complete len:330 (+) Transcript_32670:384-1373(+)